jgi:hypothetical protein
MKGWGQRYWKGTTVQDRKADQSCSGFHTMQNSCEMQQLMQACMHSMMAKVLGTHTMAACPQQRKQAPRLAGMHAATTGLCCTQWVHGW